MIDKHKPDILHISAHGEPDGQMKFRDKGGGSFSVDPVILRDLFTYDAPSNRVKCIILNSCGSVASAKELSQAIKCVIAIRGKIKNDVAALFTSEFYYFLASGKNVQGAFDFSILQLTNAKLSSEADKIKLVEEQQGFSASQISFV